MTFRLGRLLVSNEFFASPNWLFAVKDEREHWVSQGHEGELCSLDLTPPGDVQGLGPLLVLTTGSVLSEEISFTVRLSVFRFGGEIFTFEDCVVNTPGGLGVVLSNPLALSLTVELPGEGGGSSGTPPPHPRVAISVEFIRGGGNALIKHLRIAALQADWIRETTIPPGPVLSDVGSETGVEALMRMARERVQG